MQTFDSDTVRIARNKIRQIFQYLQALNSHRNPVRKRIEDHEFSLWMDGLPVHPSIRLGDYEEIHRLLSTKGHVIASSQAPGEEWILKVRRAPLKDPPALPVELTDWVEEGWQDPAKELRIRENLKDKNGNISRMAENPELNQLALQWKKKRDVWAVEELPARQSMKLFETLYQLHGRMARDSESLELVLGDGILRWKREDGGIHHPLILQKVQLRFDPEIPEFQIFEVTSEVQFYSSIFHSVAGVDSGEIAKLRESLNQQDIHPLENEHTSTFLRKLTLALSAKGEFIDAFKPVTETENPQIGRCPIIFLRKRNLGFAVALESVLQDLNDPDEISNCLTNIVGLDAASLPEQTTTEKFDEKEILFSKSTNAEQAEIARRLEVYGNVLVQGPPGTGKSHTIANLIGHILSQGKSVLVTSHATKALRVLKEHIVDELRPLCVSVLESDTESHKQLEGSVSGIVERITRIDATTYENEARVLDLNRRELLADIDHLTSEIKAARSDEYRDIVVGGRAFSPSDAARKIADEREKNDWIPGPITPDAMLPLTKEQVGELYILNSELTNGDELDLTGALLSPDLLPHPEKFDRLVNQYLTLQAAEDDYRADLWSFPAEKADLEALRVVLGKSRSIFEQMDTETTWKLSVFEAGKRGGAWRTPWEDLIKGIEDSYAGMADTQHAYSRMRPHLSETMTIQDQVQIISDIEDHLCQGGTLGWLTLLRHGTWKSFLQGTRVKDRMPASIEEIRALKTLGSFQLKREEVIRRWNEQLAALTVPKAQDLAGGIEEMYSVYRASLKDCLEWFIDVWCPLLNEIRGLGFNWDSMYANDSTLPPGDSVIRIKAAVMGPLSEALQMRITAVERVMVGKQLEEIEHRVSAELSRANSSIGREIQAALQNKDAKTYRIKFIRLQKLWILKPRFERRNALLSRLEVVAPKWAAMIRRKESPHSSAAPPGDPEPAWLWLQVDHELDVRGGKSINEMQQKLNRMKDDLHAVTVELIDRRAWAAQRKRTRIVQQQALVGWLDTVRRIGKGTGKRAPILRAEASKRMSECRGAVPVWIMPLSRVVENFFPKIQRFDVVIIDEASQSDVMALLAFYLGRKVVVVGDHEQVSPLAVGQNLDLVQQLINQFLPGIPNAQLYDGQMSVYDLARQSFPGTVRLLEHFRCVPEIIGFSNMLSYEWSIKPLRDGGNVKTLPAVVAYRAQSIHASGKTNQQEAATVASLVISAIDQPEYREKTFGVISLVGEEQAFEIERLLLQHVSPREFENRRIVCGNAAQFQGDERDVMFLSVVDVALDGPLPLRATKPFQQRFNVAASRARDQIWIVHSLSPERDLKPGDLRRALIQYAQDPSEHSRMMQATESRTESEFEKEVARRLLNAGYKVTPQWRVGYYRIDLVVEGAGKKLAIECDGDRFHPIEKLEEDLLRQSILERLKWQFVRIRGSQYFRDPEKAMQPVFQRLQAVDIPPEREREPAAESKTTELLGRVIREADEIRRAWGNDGLLQGEFAAKEVDYSDVETVPTPVKELPSTEIPRKRPTPVQARYVMDGPSPSRESGAKNTHPSPPPDSIEKPQPKLEDQSNTMRWFQSTNKDLWFALAHFAKDKNLLNSFERKFLFNMGVVLSRGNTASEKQATLAAKLFKELVGLGFSDEDLK